MMDRRTLISGIALATVCVRSGAFAQQHRSWRVGFVALPKRPEPLEGSRFGAFALGMRELGYSERLNLTIEWRFAGGDGGRLPEQAAEGGQRKRIREALATPGRPGVRVIAKQFGVNPGTVQRISRPFEQDAVAL